MAKFDIEAAYRNITVHPDDHFLLGLKWRGNYYVDLALPSGLRSAPFIFNSLADMVEWISMNRHHVLDLLHYLDDFITAGPPNSDRCVRNLQTAQNVCCTLGLPLHPGKCVGPVTKLVVLGIELDSRQQSTHLPEEKLVALRALITSWRNRLWCSRSQLESLIGHLHHAAKVVWPGRAFLRQLNDLLCCFQRCDHPIRLNSEFQLYLQWWDEFLSSWHGMSFWLFPGTVALTNLEVTSDTSGSLGFGTYFQGEWFSGAWATCHFGQSIAYKELFPIVIAAHIWGPRWSRHHILLRSDNEAVIHILVSKTSKTAGLMFLLHNLLSVAARFNFTFTALHVPGVHNQSADALSRFHWQDFRRLAPEANATPVPVPQQLLEVLSHPLLRQRVSSS